MFVLLTTKVTSVRQTFYQTGEQRQYFREQNYGRVSYSNNHDDGFLDKIKNRFGNRNSLTSDNNQVIIKYNKELGFRKIKGIHTQKSDLKNTNPNFITGKEEYRRNCQRCVNAYEARRRGYDVEALPRILDGSDKLPRMKDKVNGWTAVYKNPKLIFCGGNTVQEVLNNVYKSIGSFGKDSRVIIRIQRPLNGGHVFIAEAINGKTQFIDPQSNKVGVERYFNNIKYDSVYILRIDNLEFTDKLKECCKDKEN